MHEGTNANGGKPPAPARLRNLHRRTHRFRTLGMGLGILPVAVVLHELDAGWWSWAWLGACGLLWPQLAYLLASRSRDPYRAEQRNFMIDSAMAGSLAAVMHFNLLPSAMLLTVASADKINSGVRGLWLRSLPGMFGMLALFGLLNGFRVDLASSTPVVLACLPLMMIHTLAVSASSYQLIRKVQKQNQRLDELSRYDALTGLESRGHWQEEVAALLRAHATAAQPACLLLVDVDLLKHINDRHGHATGDDVLRGIAGAIRHAMPAGSHPGRLGGDEFAVALPFGIDDARQLGERIRAAVAALEFPRVPALKCSVSVGIAEPPGRDADLREWMEAADRVLYRAKAAGRNRTHAVASESEPA